MAPPRKTPAHQAQPLLGNHRPMQHVGNVLAARKDLGKCCCSSSVSVPVVPCEQENPFHYGANKPTPAMLNPTAHLSTGQILLSSLPARAEQRCSARGLSPVGAATCAALFPVPITELCAAAWTCCVFPASSCSFFRASSLDHAYCPTAQHGSAGTKRDTSPAQTHARFKPHPRRCCRQHPPPGIWCNRQLRSIPQPPPVTPLQAR